MPKDDTQKSQSSAQDNFIPSMIMGGGHEEASDWHFVLFCQVYEGLPSLLVHMGVVDHHTLPRYEALVCQPDSLFLPSSPVIACHNHPLFFKPCSYHRFARSLFASTVTKFNLENSHTWMPTIKVRDGWGVIKVVGGSIREGQETGGWKEGSLYLEVGERPRNSSSGVRKAIFRFKASSRSLQEKSFFFPAAHFFGTYILCGKSKALNSGLLLWNIRMQFMLYPNLIASQLLFQLRLQCKTTCFCPPFFIISGHVCHWVVYRWTMCVFGWFISGHYVSCVGWLLVNIEQ